MTWRALSISLYRREAGGGGGGGNDAGGKERGGGTTVVQGRQLQIENQTGKQSSDVLPTNAETRGC
jgi:hypothetical protein